MAWLLPTGRGRGHRLPRPPHGGHLAENKTQPTDADVGAFLDAVPHEGRRRDAHVLLDLMTELSGEPARMWGPSLVGFGTYHYVYDSGREGDFFRVGFSPRKANLVVYLMPGFEGFGELLARLGKHKLGSSCLYLNRLADVDMSVLRELVVASLAEMRERYP